MRYILDGKEITREEVEKLGLTVVTKENYNLITKDFVKLKLKEVKLIKKSLTDEELIKLTSIG